MCPGGTKDIKDKMKRRDHQKISEHHEEQDDPEGREKMRRFKKRLRNVGLEFLKMIHGAQAKMEDSGGQAPVGKERERASGMKCLISGKEP